MVYNHKDDTTGSNSCLKQVKKKSLKRKKAGEMVSLSSISSASKRKARPKALNSHLLQNNPILCKHLTITLPAFEPAIFEDSRQYIFHSKTNDALNAKQGKECYWRIIKREILQILFEKLLKHK